MVAVDVVPVWLRGSPNNGRVFTGVMANTLCCPPVRGIDCVVGERYYHVLSVWYVPWMKQPVCDLPSSACARTNDALLLHFHKAYVTKLDTIDWRIRAIDVVDFHEVRHAPANICWPPPPPCRIRRLHRLRRRPQPAP